jgi:hypothetical protein
LADKAKPAKHSVTLLLLILHFVPENNSPHLLTPNEFIELAYLKQCSSRKPVLSTILENLVSKLPYSVKY